METGVNGDRILTYSLSTKLDNRSATEQTAIKASELGSHVEFGLDAISDRVGPLHSSFASFGRDRSYTDFGLN